MSVGFWVGSDTMKVETETGFGCLTKPEKMCYLY
jgi:hypothetical protein